MYVHLTISYAWLYITTCRPTIASREISHDRAQVTFFAINTYVKTRGIGNPSWSRDRRDRSPLPFSTRRGIMKSPPPRHASGRKLVHRCRCIVVFSLSNSRARSRVRALKKRTPGFLPPGTSSTCPADFSFPAFHASARIYFTRNPIGVFFSSFFFVFCTWLRAFSSCISYQYIVTNLMQIIQIFFLFLDVYADVY